MANNKKKYYNAVTQSEPEGEAIVNDTETVDNAENDEIVANNEKEEIVEVSESIVDEVPKPEPVVKDDNIVKEDIKKMEEENMESPVLNKQYTTGKTVVLDKTDVYATSKSINVKAKLTGTYYLTSGKLENGRYRISNIKSPDKKHAVGYIAAKDVK